jgi:hypothetical protein
LKARSDQPIKVVCPPDDKHSLPASELFPRILIKLIGGR